MIVPSFSNFHKQDPENRLKLLAEKCELNQDEVRLLSDLLGTAKKARVDWVENQVSGFLFPLAIGTGFVINNTKRLIPMVTEEAGIVAGSSFGAKVTASTGGFTSKLMQDWVLGHIVCSFDGHLDGVVDRIELAKESLIEDVDKKHKLLKKAGGGLKDVHLYQVKTADDAEYLKIDLIVDCPDLMGAGLVTTMAEELAKLIGRLVDCRPLLRVISNDSTGRLCECTAQVEPVTIGGQEIAEAIALSSEYAFSDPQRAVTHNKGILNGMTAFAAATGNDTRAVEASAHYFASSSGSYQPLSSWKMAEEGTLKGILRVPAPLGSLGGATRKSRLCELCYKILGTDSGVEIREICVAVGLAANLGVLRALVTSGIGQAHRPKA